MRTHIFQGAFKNVQPFLKTEDRRSESWKREVRVARREFLAEVREIAEQWFDEHVKKLPKT